MLSAHLIRLFERKKCVSQSKTKKVGLVKISKSALLGWKHGNLHFNVATSELQLQNKKNAFYLLLFFFFFWLKG